MRDYQVVKQFGREQFWGGIIRHTLCGYEYRVEREYTPEFHPCPFCEMWKRTHYQINVGPTTDIKAKINL